MGPSRRLRRRCRFHLRIRIGHTFEASASWQYPTADASPRRALKAGSTLPPLARSTARTTAASILGNASFRVFSACCIGFPGLGGFGGATSSPEPGVGRADCVSFFGVGARGWGEAQVSWGSSSKSSSRAVVGDSGGFCVSSQFSLKLTAGDTLAYGFLWI